MSEDLGVIEGKHGQHAVALYVNAYASREGHRIQFTPTSGDYFTMDRAGVEKLKGILEGWLNVRDAAKAAAPTV